MRFAFILPLLLLSDYSTSFAGADVMSFPSSPAAQACQDHFPSASKDPEGTLRCLDILERAAADRWKAMYVAKHPDTKACRDNPPSLSDPARVSQCSTLIDQEDIAAAYYKDKLRENTSQLRKHVNDYAARKAARKEERINGQPSIGLEAEIEGLDQEIEQLEAGSRMMMSPPFPTVRESIMCTSSQVGSYTYTNCY